MKKQLFFAVSLLVAVLFSSCKNMADLDPSLFTATPNPLEAKGGKVETTITGTFPVKYFNKKAVVTVTPVLKLSNGDSVMAEPKIFQGEKIVGNDNLIAYKAGGSYSMNATFKYVPEMAVSELYLYFKVKAGKKTYNLKPVKVADGVIATSELAQKKFTGSNGAVIVGDKFVRDIMQMTDADILFLIQQSTVRGAETNAEDVKAILAKINETKTELNKSVENFTVSAYASPDGSLDLNTGLAEKRQKETVKFLNAELKKLKSSLTVESRFTPEDWEGFQKLMENSSIQDKDLILRVLSMYQDPEQREREIKNLSAAFKQIADDILPQLRRSQLKLMVKVSGKTDAEIAKLAKEDASKLSVEELLFAATLTTDAAEKAAIYQKVIDNYPTCMRGYNNLGAVKYNGGDVVAAAPLFAKALELQPKCVNASYNLALCELAKGNLAKAEELLGKAAGTSGNVKNALGTIYIINGDYAKAKSVLSGVSSNNAGLVQILNKEYNAAKNTLTGVDPADAMTSYLAAIVAARTNDKDGVYAALKTAIAKKAAVAKKAAKDLEFSKFWSDDTFKSIVK
jgi:tetratricopeptide (TPR) repeat protein